MCLQAHNKPKNAHRLELFCIAFQYNPTSFTFLDWPSDDVLSVPHAYLKNKLKKYQLNLKRIQNLALSNNVALPWLQRHKNSEQKMVINVGKTQI